MLNLQWNATSVLWAKNSFNFLLTSFTQTYSENIIFTKGSGGKKGGPWELVASGRGMHLGLVVEGEEWVLGTWFFGKGHAPRTCCWSRRVCAWNLFLREGRAPRTCCRRRRVGALNLCRGVLSATTHPQQYREFQARQARNRNLFRRYNTYRVRTIN